MALIKCTECGHMVSDKAVKCPKCGIPLQMIVETTKPIEKEEKVVAEIESVKMETHKGDTSIPESQINPHVSSNRRLNYITFIIVAFLLIAVVVGITFKKDLLSHSKDEAVISNTVGIEKEYVVKGIIESRIGFSMRLNISGNEVEGIEHYDSQKSDVTLSIKGTIDGNHKMTLFEYDNDILCGKYEGVLNDGIYQGTFTLKSGKTMKFYSEIYIKMV